MHVRNRLKKHQPHIAGPLFAQILDALEARPGRGRRRVISRVCGG
jgi:hypothetical protein